jgi:hypothetical protein
VIREEGQRKTVLTPFFFCLRKEWIRMGWYAAAIMLGILGVVLLLLIMWTVFVFTARPKYFFSLWLGVPFLGFVVLICLGFVVSFYQSRPGVVFQGAVGFAPPVNVVIVNSLRDMPIDWDDTHLVFYASDSIINQILQDGFASIRAGEIIEDSYEAPSWWTPPTGPSIRIYATNTRDPHFRDETWRWSVRHKLLIYDPNSGDPEKRKVYFRYRRS